MYSIFYYYFFYLCNVFERSHLGARNARDCCAPNETVLNVLKVLKEEVVFCMFCIVLGTSFVFVAPQLLQANDGIFSNTF
jgi:hypothetical protein